MINNIGNFNIKDIMQNGIRVSELDQKRNEPKSFKDEKTDLEVSESLKETIGALKNSIAQNRTDRVQYDMTSLNQQNDNDLKFL